LKLKKNPYPSNFLTRQWLEIDAA